MCLEAWIDLNLVWLIQGFHKTSKFTPSSMSWRKVRQRIFPLCGCILHSWFQGASLLPHNLIVLPGTLQCGNNMRSLPKGKSLNRLSCIASRHREVNKRAGWIFSLLFAIRPIIQSLSLQWHNGAFRQVAVWAVGLFLCHFIQSYEFWEKTTANLEEQHFKGLSYLLHHV